MKADLACQALKCAYGRRKPPAGLIMHSDRYVESRQGHAANVARVESRNGLDKSASFPELVDVAVTMELEGIVAKDAASIYTAGRPTRWQKIKTAVGAERERQRR